MKLNYILIFLILFSFEACDKPHTKTCPDSSFTLLKNEYFEKSSKDIKYTNSILILNEGGFTYGNSSISAYNPNTKEIENNIFKSVNDFSLGDIAQSFINKGEYTYIVVNNSQKIEVVKTSSFERKKTILGFPSPRYLVFDVLEKVLVTDLYEKKINVVNLATACNEASIPTKGWTEQIIVTDNGTWAIERNGIGESKFANLILLDKENLNILKRISIPIEPNSIVKDNEDNFWILSSGLESDNELPQLIKFNTLSHSITKTFDFNDNLATPQNLVFNTTNNFLTYNRGKYIFSISDNDASLPNLATFQSNASNNIYGIHINPNNGEYYICDAIDYVSNGKVYRYSNSYSLLDEINVGVIPSKILF